MQTFNCLKHINTQKYASYDEQTKSFLLIDTCDNNNNVEYKDNNLIYNGVCMNPNGIFKTVPDRNIPLLSICDKTTNIKMELINDPILSFASIAEKIPITNIFNITVPTTFSTFRDLNIPTKYTTAPPLALNNTKIKISDFGLILILTNNILYISTDNGKNWKILTASVRFVELNETKNITFNNVEDFDMSENGKFIMISDNRSDLFRFYVSNDYGKFFKSQLTDITSYNAGNVVYFAKVDTKTGNRVCMSRNGKVQISYISEIKLKDYTPQYYSVYNISYNSGSDFQRKYFQNKVNERTEFNSRSHENSNYIKGILITYDGSVVSLIKYIPDKYIQQIVYLYNEYNGILQLPYINRNIDIKISFNTKNIYVLYRNLLKYSNDYGNTWKNFISNIDMNKIKISRNGKYVFLLISTDSSSNLIYSSDYGNTFNNFQTSDIIFNNNDNRYFYDFDLTDDGTELILLDSTNFYFINTNEKSDIITYHTNERMILPEEEFKYLYKSFIKENNIKIIKIIKNGRDIFATINEIIISGKLINVILYNENENLYNSFYIPNVETVTNICIYNNNYNMLYTKGNKIYNYSHNEVFSSIKDIVYITSNKVGNIYLALSDKIHISKDSINWDTVNMESRQWIRGCISEELNLNQFYSITIIEEIGNIFISLDSGVNWKSSNIFKPNYWNSISMSNDGIVQLCTCKKDIPFISYDYGVSWTPIDFKYNLKDSKGNYISEFVDCSVSEDGNIMLAIVNNGNVLICNNKKWQIYGEYEYERSEINGKDTHYNIYTSPSIYGKQIDHLTSYYDPTIISDYNFLNSFKLYSTSTSVFEINLPYNNFIYTGKSKTKDIDTNLDINAEYIEIQFVKNLLFNLNRVYLGSNLSNLNKNNNISNLRIMGSNDGINYKQLINITDNNSYFNLSELVYNIRTDLYFNNYRIVLDNIKTIS